MNDIEAAIRWYLFLTLIAMATAPLIWWLGSGLRAGRQALLRPLSLVIVTLVVWWPAAAFGLPFRQLSIWIAVSVLGVLSWTLQLRYSKIPFREFRNLIAFELFWLALFSGYLWFRSYNPDIANTEKPMEISLLNAVSKSEHAPANDPWFAGATINYYYFGYQQLASVINAVGVSTSVAFNLGLATAFASIGVAASAIAVRIAYCLHMRYWSGIGLAALASLFVVFSGNLHTAMEFVRSPSGTIDSGWWDGIGWNASRIIYDTGVHGNPEPAQTINEFPAFSFVLGDLHPHLLAYPLLLSVIALAVGLALTPKTLNRWRLVSIGALSGILYATNSWDAPIGLVVLVSAIVIALDFSWRASILPSVYVIAGALFAALPFAASYTTPVGVDTDSLPRWISELPLIGSLLGSVAIVDWRPSSVSELLTVHGAWIAVAGLFIFWALRGNQSLVGKLRERQELLLVVSLVAFAIAIVWAPAVIFLGVPLAGCGLLTVFDRRSTVRIAAGLFALGFFLTLVPEFLYVQDSFGNRMNTVFKLYFQAWLFLAIGSAIALALIIKASNGTTRLLVAGATAAIIIATIPYSVLASYDWMKLGDGSIGLDGAAYIATKSPDEAAAIAWLQQHAGVDDVIVEAPGCGYGTHFGVPMNRFSAFTGTPTVLGWSNHEGQWRRGESPSIYPRLEERNREANAWLNGETPTIHGYDEPRFVIYGPQETDGEANCSLLVPRGETEFSRLISNGWAVVFNQGRTRILAREHDPVVGLGD